MSNIITSSEDLEDYILEEDDRVIFFSGGPLPYVIVIYYVAHNHLTCPKENNAFIFNYLKIKDRYDFCSYFYGYPTYGGAWPVCKSWDYESLTHLVRVIYKLTEAKELGVRFYE